MAFVPRYTKHQVARNSRPDAEQNGILFLFKACSLLRLTYQIQALTELATRKKAKLRIQIPRRTKVHSALRSFQNEHAKIVKIEKV